MNEIKIFSNPEFGQVRTINMNGEPWFVGKDVAKILGYSKPENAMSAHVDEEDKTTTLIQGTGSNYKSKAVIINESGLYSLVLSSKLPEAKKFKRWVTSEILPSIRKHGGYIAGQEEMEPEELLSRALLFANSKIEEMTKQIAELTPKALFADAVSDTDDTVLVGELAKILKQNGVDIGERRLYSWFRENGYLIKRRGSDYNMPTQKSMNNGLFRIVERMVTRDGEDQLVKTSKVTGKGQKHFVNIFIKKRDAA